MGVVINVFGWSFFHKKDKRGGEGYFVLQSTAVESHKFHIKYQDVPVILFTYHIRLNNA